MTPTINGVPTDVQAAVSLTTMQTTIFSLLGTFILIVLGWRVSEGYAKKHYVEMVGALAGALIALWIVVTPDNALATLADWRTSIFG